VFHFRAVTSSPGRPSREAGAQTVNEEENLDFLEDEEEISELADLDVHSSKSSFCDCPAHIHDRETPLKIDKGHSQAFILPNINLLETNFTSNPPSPMYRAAPEASETGQTSASPTPGLLYLPPNYSYACLDKKWSL